MEVMWRVYCIRLARRETVRVSKPSWHAWFDGGLCSDSRFCVFIHSDEPHILACELVSRAKVSEWHLRVSVQDFFAATVAYAYDGMPSSKGLNKVHANISQYKLMRKIFLVVDWGEG